MKIQSIRQAVAVAAVLAATWGVTAPANAALAIASFDPAYGAIPNLGYQGTAQFFVPDACLGQGNGLVSNGSACSPSSNIALILATIDFYNINDVNKATVATATYGPGSLTVQDIDVEGGEVVGIDTTISSSQIISISQAGLTGIDYSGPISIQFFSGYVPPPILLVSALATTNAALPAPITSYIQLYNCPSNTRSCSANDLTASNPAATLFTTVPEPSTVLLMLGALGGLGWSRTRRLGRPASGA